MTRTLARWIGGIAASLVLGAGAASAATPPTNSPAAQGLHPRLFVAAGELPALRDRITSQYQSEFQTFLDLLANTSGLSSGQQGIETEWGCLNYAFLAMLDPAEMQRRGFVIDPSIDTPQECTAKAMSYARSLLPSISTAAGQSHGDLAAGYPTTIYFPVLAVYDWCFPYLVSGDRTAIVDAFVSAYVTKYQGQSTLTMPISGQSLLGNNQASADIHDILGIVAFYGDSYPAATLQREMYSVFEDIWIHRVITELDYFYAKGTNWHEGPGGYLNEGFLNLGLPIAMFSSALGVDYPGTMPFFTEFAPFAILNAKPLSLAAGCGSGSSPCSEYMERWGTISGGITELVCKAAILDAGLLRRSFHPNASLAVWAHEQMSTSCQTAVTVYGGLWSNAVLYMFLYGDKEVAPASPDRAGMQASRELGMGEFAMKSGFGADATQVIFWAKPHWMYGHVSDDQGHFSIHKFGNLVLTAANSKSGDAVLTSAKFNLFMNSVGIHKSGSDQRLDFDGSVTDPFFGSRGITDIRTAGSVMAADIGNPGYDYVAYDTSPSWAAGTADIAQRELVYSHGATNNEYVVLLDRVRVPSPQTSTKIWKIWVPRQPVFLDGTPANPRGGKWTSSNTTLLSMTNQLTLPVTPRYESPSTHGRLFLKVLMPQNAVVSALGGPGQEFQSGDDDGSTPWGAPSMTDAMREYLGWGRIQVTPSAANSYDAFLNVMQFGDANTLAAMSPTVRVVSNDAKMLGADIRNSGGNRVVLFSSAQDGARVVAPVSYVFTPAASTSNHLLADMQPSTAYFVSRTSAGGAVSITVDTTPSAGAVTVSSNSQGVLDFVLSGLTVLDPVPPGAVRDLRPR